MEPQEQVCRRLLVCAQHGSSPRVQLALGYQLDAPFLFGDVYQSSGYRQRAEAAVVLRIGSRLDLSAGYQLAVLPTTFRHAIATELSIKLPRSVVLLLALRPALDHQINLSLLLRHWDFSTTSVQTCGSCCKAFATMTAAKSMHLFW